MKLMSPNLHAAQLKNVDALLAGMLVDKPVTAEVFGSIVPGDAIPNAALAAATAVAHFVTTAESNVSHTAIVSNPTGAAAYKAVSSLVSVHKTPEPSIMKRKIVTALKGNIAQALSLKELIMLRKEALN